MDNDLKKRFSFIVGTYWDWADVARKNGNIRSMKQSYGNNPIHLAHMFLSYVGVGTPSSLNGHNSILVRYQMYFTTFFSII